jgi:hypothetical protein
MNSIVRVGDGDGLYGEQWNLSGEPWSVYCPQGFKPTAAGCSLL